MSPFGLEGVTRTMLWLPSVFSDQYWEVHDVIGEDDVVATRVTHHGRQTGELMGIPPTGREVAYQYVHFLRFRDGKAVEQWSVRDDILPMRSWASPATTRHGRGGRSRLSDERSTRTVPLATIGRCPSASVSDRSSSGSMTWTWNGPSGRRRSTTWHATATTTRSPCSTRATVSARTCPWTGFEPRARPPKIHLDLYAVDQAVEVERLKGLGATEVHWDKQPADGDYVIMQDPEGNRFCVIDAG